LNRRAPSKGSPQVAVGGLPFAAAYRDCTRETSAEDGERSSRRRAATTDLAEGGHWTGFMAAFVSLQGRSARAASASVVSKPDDVRRL